MSDTVRQTIADRLLEMLQGISKENGYSEDYPYIDEWRLTGLEHAEKPAIVLIDPEQSVAATDMIKTDWLLNITISIIARGDESQSGLRNYAADIYKCIGADPGLGDIGVDIVPRGDTLQLSQEDDVYGDIDIRFEIAYSTKTWDLTCLL